MLAVREQVENILSNHWLLTISVTSLLSTANISINSYLTTKLLFFILSMDLLVGSYLLEKVCYFQFSFCVKLST